MFIYTLLLLILIAILGGAAYALIGNFRKEDFIRTKEYNFLKDPDTIVDFLISELMKIDKIVENEDTIEERKKDILNTFVELHRSGSFCAHLTEEEVIAFVKTKLFNGDEK